MSLSLSLSLKSPNEIRNEVAERSGEATRSQVPKSLRIPSVNLVVRLLFFAGNRHRALRCAWTNRKPVHGEPLRRRCEPEGVEESPHPHPPRWLLPIVLFRTTTTSTFPSMAPSYCPLPQHQHPHIHFDSHFLLSFSPQTPPLCRVFHYCHQCPCDAMSPMFSISTVIKCTKALKSNER